MNCDIFVNRLDALLTGDLDAAVRTELLAHAARCERCGPLLAAMRSDPAPATTDTPGDTERFVARLLQRTSGSSCTRAQTELPDWVDGVLAADETPLVELHLQHCAGCAALAVVLRTLRQELPALAHAEPGPAFTAAVVAATRALQPRRLARAPRWRALWEQLVGRPRLALEFATAACFVLMLLCALPFSPFRPLPQQALAIVRVDVVGLLQSAATELGPGLNATAARVWAGSGGRLESAVASRQRDFAREHAATAAAWDALRADLAEAGVGIRSGNLAQLSHALHAVRGDLKRLFGAAPPAPPAAVAPGGGAP